MSSAQYFTQGSKCKDVLEDWNITWQTVQSTRAESSEQQNWRNISSVFTLTNKVSDPNSSDKKIFVS